MVKHTKRRKTKRRKKPKITEIRKISKKRPKEAKKYLNLALDDIHKEEIKLRQKIKDIKKQIGSTNMRMTRTHGQEDKLRNDLSKLVTLESRINAKKTKLKTILVNVNDRLVKIKKIDDEIKAASID